MKLSRIVSTWPLSWISVVALEGSGWSAAMTLSMRFRGRVQIASLNVGMNVEYRPDVELRGNHRHFGAAELGDVHQELGVLRRGRGHRQRPQILSRVDA